MTFRGRFSIVSFCFLSWKITLPRLLVKVSSGCLQGHALLYWKMAALTGFFSIWSRCISSQAQVMPGFSLFQEIEISSSKSMKPLPCRVVISLSQEWHDSFWVVASLQLSFSLPPKNYSGWVQPHTQQEKISQKSRTFPHKFTKYGRPVSGLTGQETSRNLPPWCTHSN